jgi:hypothetical protein
VPRGQSEPRNNPATFLELIQALTKAWLTTKKLRFPGLLVELIGHYSNRIK